jgi:hypothetical protein
VSAAENPAACGVAALTIPKLADDITAVEAALAYAKAGWYVGPVKQGTKDPGSVLGKGWQHKTTRDQKEIHALWAGNNHGVFLHAGRSGAVLLDMDYPEKAPSDILTALKNSWAPFQRSRIDADGRGHYIFRTPAGRCIGNSAGQLHGCGFEIRGNNGVIIAAPSVHAEAASGGRYQWEITGAVPVLPAIIADKLPDATEATEAATDEQIKTFLATHVTATHPALIKGWRKALTNHFETGSRHDGAVSVTTGAMKEARAGFLAATETATELQSMFITAATRAPTGGEKQRTQQQAEAEFASILGWAIAQADAADIDQIRERTNEKMEDKLLTGMPNPFAGSALNGAAPDQDQDRTHGPGPVPDPGSELAENTTYAGTDMGPNDDETSSDQGRSNRSQFPPLGSGPRDRLARPYTDIVALLDGGLPAPPKPSVLKRRDGNHIFYAGQVNWLFGDPEVGKTFVALAAVVEKLILGGTALFIDLDHNGADAAISRLLMMGAPEAVLRDPDRFRYADPDEPDEVRTVINDAKEWKPDVVVVDSVGELLPMFRANSNSADEFTVVHSRVLKPLAKIGSAVIAVDHLAKSADSRAHGPGGTFAKKRAVGGVSIRVKALEVFTPGEGGCAIMLIHKDRHGGLRAVSPKPTGGGMETIAGTFILKGHSAYLYPGDLPWHVASPKEGDRDPDTAAEPELVAQIEAMDPPPTTVEEARKRLGVRKERVTKAYVEWKTKQRNNTTEKTEDN